MKEEDLISRINEASEKFDHYSSLHLLYFGILNLERSCLIKPEEIIPKNVNLREATKNLLETLLYAIEIKVLVEIYLNDYQPEEEYKKILEERIKYAENVIMFAKNMIGYSIAQLPNEFTYLKKK
jgi:hypothetical protein